MAICTVLTFGLGLGCTGGDEDFFVPPDGELDGTLYVGDVEGSDAVIAFAVRERNVVGYVCGGEATFASLSRWFCGEANAVDGGLDIVVHEAGWTLDAQIDDTTVRGTLRNPDGSELAIVASRAADGAGLFANEVGGCSTGVIAFAPEGDAEPEVHGTFCADEFDLFEQVTPVRPYDDRDNALNVLVGAGAAPMTVYRVQP